MSDEWQAELTAFLAGLRTEAERARLRQVAGMRTRALTVVTEDLYQPHNGAAVVRACDNFGVQDVYAFSDRNAFRIDETVAAGADRAVDVHHVRASDGNSIGSLAADLKQRGYRVVATTLRPGSVRLDELAVDTKLALMFGTEEQGLTDAAHEAADAFVWLPMYGFTQSFNISVSLAVSLFNLTTRLRASNLSWQLSTDEQADVLLSLLCRYDEAARAAAVTWLQQHNIDQTLWPLGTPD